MTNPFSNKPARYLDKDLTIGERSNYAGWWKEQIEQYGVEVNYYRNNYDTQEQDFIYGEHPDQRFSDPVKIVMALTMNEGALTMSKFGLLTDDEVTCMITYESFVNTLGLSAEPNSGDIMELEEYGRGRPGGRTGKIFEITGKVDQDASQINQLQGHYVWLLTAKRFEYSYEPNAPLERPFGQMTDDVQEGRLPGGKNEPVIIKSYKGDVDDVSQPIYDYRVFMDPDHIYGDY